MRKIAALLLLCMVGVSDAAPHYKAPIAGSTVGNWALSGSAADVATGAMTIGAATASEVDLGRSAGTVKLLGNKLALTLFGGDGGQMVDSAGSALLKLSTASGVHLMFGANEVNIIAASMTLTHGTKLVFAAPLIDPSANTARLGSVTPFAEIDTAKLIATTATSGNAIAVKGNASNFSALALFRDANNKAHFGIDAAGFASLGDTYDFREHFLWGYSLSGYTTGGVIAASGNAWSLAPSGTPNGIAGGNTTAVDATSALINSMILDPSTANANQLWLTTTAPMLAPQNNTNLYFCAEWSGMLATSANTNMTFIAGVSNSSTITHPRGWGFQKISGIANWQAFSDDGATMTNADSGVAPVANTWQRFRVEYYGAGTFTAAKVLRFFINGALVASICASGCTTTATPYSTLSMNPVFGVQNTAVSAGVSARVAAARYLFNTVSTPTAP